MNNINTILSFYAKVPFNVGVDENYFDTVYRRQRNSNWFLPATFESLARYYGHDVYQEQIVAENCGVHSNGSPKNCTTQWYIFNSIVNGCTQDYCVNVDFGYNFSNGERLYNELSQAKPVIIDHLTQGAVVGHAYIITGMEGYFLNGQMYLTQLRLRDPARFANGRAMPESLADFMARTRAHWFFDINAVEVTNEPVWVGLNPVSYNYNLGWNNFANRGFL